MSERTPETLYAETFREWALGQERHALIFTRAFRAARVEALREAEQMLRDLASDAEDDGDGSENDVSVALDDAADAIRSLIVHGPIHGS